MVELEHMLADPVSLSDPMPISAGIALAALLFTATLTIIGGVWKFATDSAVVLAAIKQLGENDAGHTKKNDELRVQVNDNTLRIRTLETENTIRHRFGSHPDIAPSR